MNPLLPIVAVVGRPNVGKSSLVNRVVGGRQAVVEEMPGVTRDRRNFETDWAGRNFILVDTGGWEADTSDGIGEAVRAQAESALAGADVVIWVVDATIGVTDDDVGVVRLLRRTEVPVVLAANKVDDVRTEAAAAELWNLGMGEPFPVSALHGRGLGDLLDRVVELLPLEEEPTAESELPRLALVGRPNVGKSTLLNRLVGEERVIVSPTPGTTRDPIDAIGEIDGRQYLLIDTAGIRRRAQIGESADFYAVDRARRVLASADVAIVLIDGQEGVTHQDQRILDQVIAAGSALVVIINKWDRQQTEDQREDAERSIEERLGFVDWAPMMRASALTGARLHRLGKFVEQALESRSRRVGTGELNRMIERWTAAHPPPVRKGRRPKINYAVQAGVAPPTIVLFVSGGELGEDYVRFLENRLREEVEFIGTPIRIITRKRERR
ncbi:MAG TPA: ribosome biogenesis GTPase Der [Acidimicrobiia bacterium]|nr:ribosome biogenesis GTPase Der [Acidimicrobiia bacterium]